MSKYKKLKSELKDIIPFDPRCQLCQLSISNRKTNEHEALHFVLKNKPLSLLNQSHKKANT